jgi:nicotinic acid mononucleotide adenylyltransferase
MVDLRGASRQSGSLLHDTPEPRIFVTDAVMAAVSATEVRQAAREGRDERLTQLVPLEVAAYIRKYELYRNSHET